MKPAPTWPIWSTLPRRPLKSSYGDGHLLGGFYWHSAVSHASSPEEFRERMKRRREDALRKDRESKR